MDAEAGGGEDIRKAEEKKSVCVWGGEIFSGCVGAL